MNRWLSTWIKKCYPDEKNDLCTCFIDRCRSFTVDNGWLALITASSWLFITSFEKMRKKLLAEASFISMIQQSVHGYPSVTVPTCMFVLSQDSKIKLGSYIRLEDFDRPQWQQPKALEAIKDPTSYWRYIVNKDEFRKIPGSPIVYWIGSSTRNAFSTYGSFDSVGHPKVGMQTSNNDKYLRLWWEVSNSDRLLEGTPKWIIYLKGGDFRKWYGNLSNLLYYNFDPSFILQQPHARVLSLDYLEKTKCTWADITTATNSFRLAPKESFYDISGHCFFPSDSNQYELLAYANSSVFATFIKLLNPTVHCQVGDVAKVPYRRVDCQDSVNAMSRMSVEICRQDWDSFETSWDFTWHPLVPSHSVWIDQHCYNMHATERRAGVERIEVCFHRWESECKRRFDQLKVNEEELNHIFARIYGMEGEVPIEVPDDKVSVRLADLGRDIRSLVSYGVGCMFGRYSLDEPGLILADEGSTLDDYHAKVPNPTFEPDRTGIIPITEFDYPFFGDDVVAQFRRWLAAAYGEDTLGENIAYIENALGKSLRAYFARDFYNDHVKIYQKRPIYWLFSSPKRGLQALVYLHRYTPQTVSQLLADYVRPLRDNLGAQARLLEVSGKAKDASLAAKYDATVAELEAWEHDVIFPLAQRHVELDLDDGVKVNYGKPEFKGALRKVVGLN